EVAGRALARDGHIAGNVEPAVAPAAALGLHEQAIAVAAARGDVAGHGAGGIAGRSARAAEAAHAHTDIAAGARRCPDTEQAGDIEAAIAAAPTERLNGDAAARIRQGRDVPGQDRAHPVAASAAVAEATDADADIA